jgi:hypothetical protein
MSWRSYGAVRGGYGSTSVAGLGVVPTAAFGAKVALFSLIGVTRQARRLTMVTNFHGRGLSTMRRVAELHHAHDCGEMRQGGPFPLH